MLTASKFSSMCAFCEAFGIHRKNKLTMLPKIKIRLQNDQFLSSGAPTIKAEVNPQIKKIGAFSLNLGTTSVD